MCSTPVTPTGGTGRFETFGAQSQGGSNLDNVHPEADHRLSL